MKKIFLTLSMLFLGACYSPSKAQQYMEQNQLIYYKDPETNVCFAFRGWGKSALFTYVPCTPEVENIITKISHQGEERSNGSCNR